MLLLINVMTIFYFCIKLTLNINCPIAYIMDNWILSLFFLDIKSFFLKVFIFFYYL